MLRLPFSFRTLLVWAFLLVALLPSLALVQMWWHLDQLSLAAESRLNDVDRWQGALRNLSEREEQLERSARQWLVLQDPVFRQLALGFAADMQQPAAQLARVDDRRFARHLNDERRQLLAITAWLSAGQAVSAQQASDDFAQLTSNQSLMEERLHALVQERQKQWADTLRQQRMQADHLALFSVGLALVLAILMGYLLFTPLGRLRLKIGKLAQGVRGQSWQVAGPTDVRVLALALQRLDERLEQLEAEKASFFRQISHELKTPLAAINEAAALLADEVPGSLSVAQHEIVAIQLSNVATLRARVDTLLRHDVARWLSQQVEFREFSLRQVLTQRLHEWNALILRRDLRVEMALEADVVVGDEQKIQTILDNLLINAIHYCSAGGVISLASRREQGTVFVRVLDQGPGVTAKDAERIFEPFFCGEPPEDEKPGSGIGLTMARTFAQLMGGDVHLLPSEIQGACFELCWPEGGSESNGQLA